MYITLLDLATTTSSYGCISA